MPIEDFYMLSQHSILFLCKNWGSSWLDRFHLRCFRFFLVCGTFSRHVSNCLFSDIKTSYISICFLQSSLSHLPTPLVSLQLPSHHHPTIQALARSQKLTPGCQELVAHQQCLLHCPAIIHPVMI